MTAEDIAGLFDARRVGRGKWMAKCPVHPDKTASLSIREGKAAVMINCFGGCDKADILAHHGLKIRDLFFGSSVTPGARRRLRDKRLLSVLKRKYEIYRWIGLTLDDDWYKVLASHGLNATALLEDPESRASIKRDPDSAAILREYDKMGYDLTYWRQAERRAVRRYNEVYTRLYPQEAAAKRRERALQREIKQVGWEAMWNRIP